MRTRNALNKLARRTSEGFAVIDGTALARTFRSCALWVFSPNGAMLDQPRATPWVGVFSQDLKPRRGDTSVVGDPVSPLQGLEFCVVT